MAAEKAKSSNAEEVTYSGKLSKRGKVNKAWKERHFVLNSFAQMLKYYENETDSNEKGKINLADITAIEVLTNYDISYIKQLPSYIIPNDNKKPDENKFTMQLISSGRTFVLATENRSDFFKWLKHLQNCLYGEIVKEGWLKKQGAVNKGWKERYMVLNRFQQMKYFDDQKRTNFLGMIDCTKINHINNGGIKPGGPRYTLELHTQQRTWILGANDKENRVCIKYIYIYIIYTIILPRHIHT